LNQTLEHAGRLADFLEFSEAMCLDALTREESCGCHFREEYQTEEGEALRNDEEFAHAAVWKYEGQEQQPSRHIEPLEFEAAPPTQRNYKT
jgi:succinate dehydrogenase / fumarate reductase flavoprotein subunit